METFSVEHALVRLLGLPPVQVIVEESADGQRLRSRLAAVGGTGEPLAGKIDLRWRGERWLRSRGVLAELLPAPWSLAGALVETESARGASAQPDALAGLLVEIARADEALSKALGDGDRRFALQGVGEQAERRTFVARRLPAVFDGTGRPWFVRPDAVDGLAASVEVRAGVVTGFDGHRKFHWRVAASPESRAAAASPGGTPAEAGSGPVVLSPQSC